MRQLTKILFLSAMALGSVQAMEEQGGMEDKWDLSDSNLNVPYSFTDISAAYAALGAETNPVRTDRTGVTLFTGQHLAQANNEILDNLSKASLNQLQMFRTLTNFFIPRIDSAVTLEASNIQHFITLYPNPTDRQREYEELLVTRIKQAEELRQQLTEQKAVIDAVLQRRFASGEEEVKE